MHQQRLQDRAAPVAPAGRYRADPEAVPALARMGTVPVVGLALTSTTGVAALDLTLTGRLSMFFDLCFVLVGLTAALVVRRQGFFAVGVLPPLLLGAVVAVLASAMPSALTATHLAFISTWLTGLAHHGGALVSTHLVVLAIIGLRTGTRAGTRADLPPQASCEEARMSRRSSGGSAKIRLSSAVWTASASGKPRSRR